MKRWLPISIAVVVLLLLGGWVYQSILSETGGVFVYALDDTYIHLTIARNLVEHGTYGINPGETAFASSSIIWPLLLAAGNAIAGSALLLPLLLNVLLAVLILFQADRMLRSEELPMIRRTVFLLLFIVFTAQLPLIFFGLEHVLHVLVVLTVFSMLPEIMEGKTISRAEPWLPLLLAVGVLVRFETLFLVSSIALVLFVRGRFRLAVMIVAASCVPLLVNGALQLLAGGYFLPNTLIVKGNFFNVFSPADWYYMIMKHVVRNLLGQYDGQLLLVSLWMLFAAALASREKRARWLPLMWIWLLTLLQHLLFAMIGWYFRYESYLLASGVIIAVVMTSSVFSGWMEAKEDRSLRRLVTVFAVLFILLPLYKNGEFAIRHLPEASVNIHGQQYQMARFLNTYYAGQPVMLNDIGAVAYYGGVHIVDLIGLGSTEVTKIRDADGFTTEAVRGLTQRNNVSVAVVYEHWFTGEKAMPAEWIPVDRWESESGHILGGRVVTFFATDSTALPYLQESLDEFEHVR